MRTTEDYQYQARYQPESRTHNAAQKMIPDLIEGLMTN